ncbi:hypothetical protein K3495_g17225, partial [Podosphaera aphanis]
YNGVPGRIITHFAVFTMQIDGHTLTQIPFLILDLGNQDVILGDGWMAHFDVLPDMRNRRLFWRTPPASRPSFARNLQIPRSLLRTKKSTANHQLDADRRCRIMEHDDKRRLDGPGSGVGIMGIRLLKNKSVAFEDLNLVKVEAILTKNNPGDIEKANPSTKPSSDLDIDILEI